VGAVGFKIVELLREKGASVRAMVHRLDARSEALERLGAEVVVGDLTSLADVKRVLSGCSRVYFGMSVSSAYLEATAVVAAVAKHLQQQHQQKGEGEGLELLVNISQMTVSEMSLESVTGSPQHQLHFLAEQVLNWSGLPVVHVRPTVFLEHFFFNQWAADSIRTNNGELRLPLGAGRTSPIATVDVARVVVSILQSGAEDRQKHIGKIYELTGPKSQGIDSMAAEYSEALGRPVKYVPADPEQFAAKILASPQLPPHAAAHIVTMAKLHERKPI